MSNGCSTAGFYADDDNVYSRPKGAKMPYTWAKDIKRLWYDNGDHIVYPNPEESLDLPAILTAIQAHIKANDGRVYYEKHTRSCTVCSYALLAYLLKNRLLGVHKDPFMYYSDKEGRRIYWQVAIHIRERGQAILGDILPAMNGGAS